MSDKEKRFEAILERAIETKVFPGSSFVFIGDGQTFSKGYGRFTYDADSPVVTTESLYDCASLTKIIGPMAVAMQLIEEGVLNLDDKVGAYLPEFLNQVEKENALLSHLMTYTLDYDIPKGSKSMITSLAPMQVAENALALHLKVLPGTNYVYSNITAFVLTMIIERVTGRNFNELIRERILLPLEMSTATLAPTSEMLENIPPTEITNDRGEVRGFVHDEFSHHLVSGGISCGAAGLFISIKDISNFLQMTIGSGQFNGKQLFGKEMVTKWTNDYYPQLLPVHTPIGWGDSTNSLIDAYHREMVVKSGFTGCFMAADLKNKKGFAILSNRTYPQRPIDASAFDQVRRGLINVSFS